jgi:hypothetical protein
MEASGGHSDLPVSHLDHDPIPVGRQPPSSALFSRPSQGQMGWAGDDQGTRKEIYQSQRLRRVEHAERRRLTPIQRRG